MTEKVTPIWYEHTYIESANNCNKSTKPVAVCGRGFVLIAARARLLFGGLAHRAMARSATSAAPATLKRYLYVQTQSGTLNGLPISASESDRRRRDGGYYRYRDRRRQRRCYDHPAHYRNVYRRPDCNGTLTSVPAGLSQNFVIRENGSQVFFIVTAHPAGVATISGEAVRVSKK